MPGGRGRVRRVESAGGGEGLGVVVVVVCVVLLVFISMEEMCMCVCRGCALLVEKLLRGQKAWRREYGWMPPILLVVLLSCVDMWVCVINENYVPINYCCDEDLFVCVFNKFGKFPSEQQTDTHSSCTKAHSFPHPHNTQTTHIHTETQRHRQTCRPSPKDQPLPPPPPPPPPSTSPPHSNPTKPKMKKDSHCSIKPYSPADDGPRYLHTHTHTHGHGYARGML
jgi:hypothetical protein